MLLSSLCFNILSSFVASTNPGSWTKVISKLNLDPNELISGHSSQLLRTVLEGMTEQREACCNALGTLLKLGPELIAPKIVDGLCELLDNPDVRGGTEDMLEIMYTPQGQLWHQGLLKE